MKLLYNQNSYQYGGENMEGLGIFFQGLGIFFLGCGLLWWVSLYDKYKKSK
jgi:divalent metal cation (Fe/Co/Zn/Cd) transporter